MKDGLRIAKHFHHMQNMESEEMNMMSGRMIDLNFKIQLITIQMKFHPYCKNQVPWNTPKINKSPTKKSQCSTTHKTQKINRQPFKKSPDNNMKSLNLTLLANWIVPKIWHEKQRYPHLVKNLSTINSTREKIKNQMPV